MIAKGMITEDNKYGESRVYIACLPSYNDGKLKGMTFNATQLDEFHDSEKWEEFYTGEYAIHDYDGDISRIGDHLGEHYDIHDLIELMNFFDITSDGIPAAMLCIARNGNIPSPYELEIVYDNMEQFDDLEQWAYESCKDCGYDVGDSDVWSPTNYIDWTRVGEDMLMDYTSIQYGHTTYMMRD